MSEVHRLLEEKGRKAAIQTNLIPRSVLEAAHLYLSDEESALAFAYSGWAQCALPHRRLPVSEPWEVKSDRMRLVVEPGRRPPGNSSDGPLEWVGVPFGAYARLILLYLQTNALRTGNREVELGRSWREWMMRIGIPWGGKSGRGVREQAELLSRCRLTFHLQGDGRAGLVNVGIVDRALFLEGDENARQGRLSLEVATLSQGFYDALKKHPIPLEEAAIRALANNSAALDCYLWLAYRLHVLTGPKLVTWKALKAQHGTSYRQLFHFKERFAGVLAMALAVYPDANVEVVDEGVILKPSRPPVAPKLIAIR
jgi:Plasmid encoded RepA protein